MRTLSRMVTVLAVFLGVTFVHMPVSHAVEVPQTLADRRPVEVGPVAPPFAIDHLGVLWETEEAHVEHGDHSQAQHGEVRFRLKGQWTGWQPLIEDGATAAGQWASALIPAAGAEAYQVRGVPADAVAPRAVALNTTDGPLVETGRRPAGRTAQALTNCLSRPQWGADEKLRFDRRGKETWPPEFHPVQTMTVHHTATQNDDPDPSSTVRAIYRYHAVDRGWGDIGYHYLIDERGNVYEGRWSGEESAPCGGTGGGTDFAHDNADELVTAGHTGGYNSGNLGAALLGTFTTAGDPQPAASALDALEGLLAESSARHQLDPKAMVDYVNPADPTATKTVAMISGHRDWVSTQCPGENLYGLLPGIRDAVAAALDRAPEVTVGSPADGATVKGSVSVSGRAADDKGLQQVALFADDSTTPIGLDQETPADWSFTWHTSSASEGEHQLTAVATDSAGQTSRHTVAVTVDNVPDPLSISGVSPSSGKQNSTVRVTISGTGFTSGAVVDLRDGQGTEPLVSDVIVATDGRSITATFTTGKTSGPRIDRPWDVAVVQGDTVILQDGFTVLR